MNLYFVSPEAEGDLFEIWGYLVGAASEEFADQVESELFDNFARLSRNPGLGHKREDLTKFSVLFYRAFPHIPQPLHPDTSPDTRNWLYPFSKRRSTNPRPKSAARAIAAAGAAPNRIRFEFTV